MYQKIFAEKKDTEVVIIDIDEKSLGKFGQFPWNRKVFAKILDQLNTSNPKAIGFDIFFTEKDKQSPEEIIKSYNLVPSDISELQNLKGLLNFEVLKYLMELNYKILLFPLVIVCLSQ